MRALAKRLTSCRSSGPRRLPTATGSSVWSGSWAGLCVLAGVCAALRQSSTPMASGHTVRSCAMFDQIRNIIEVESGQAPLPGTKGQVTMQVLNADPSQGPVLLRLVMEPGAEIARHYHAGQAETDYILEGVFIDEGRPYPAGTELNVKPGHEHGPHTTNTGVTFLSMFTGNVDLTDFRLEQ